MARVGDQCHCVIDFYYVRAMIEQKRRLSGQSGDRLMECCAIVTCHLN